MITLLFFVALLVGGFFSTKVSAFVADSGYIQNPGIAPGLVCTLSRANIVFNSTSYSPSHTTVSFGAVLSIVANYTASHTINGCEGGGSNVADSYQAKIYNPNNGCHFVFYQAPEAIYSSSSSSSGQVTTGAGGSFTLPSTCGTGSNQEFGILAFNKIFTSVWYEMGRRSTNEHINVGGAGTPTPAPSATPAPTPTPAPSPAPGWDISISFGPCTAGGTAEFIYTVAIPNPPGFGFILLWKPPYPDPTKVQQASFKDISPGRTWNTGRFFPDGTYNATLHEPRDRNTPGAVRAVSNNATVSCAAVPTPTPTPLPTPTPTPLPPPPPSAPINLTASASCNASSQPQISFFWNDSTGEDGYWLDVNAAAWTGVSSPTPWGVKTLGANVTSFIWSPASVLDSGSPTVPANGTTYWWRLRSFNAGGNSPHIYPPNSLTPPGTSVTTLNCALPPPPDLNFGDVSSELQFYTDGFYSAVRASIAYSPGETIFVQVKVKNTSPTNITTAFRVAFYIDRASDPSCGVPPDPPGTETTIPSLAGGATSPPWRFQVIAPSTPGLKIAKVFADYQCVIDEGVVNESNNIRSKSYSVDVNAWFETIGGDVGSASDTTVDQISASGRFNSTYLLAARTLGTNLTTQAGWRLNNYTRPLIPTGGTYNFLADRFRQKAISTGSQVCNIPAGLPAGNNFYYCLGDAVFHAGNGPNGNNVFFIDGNLTIDGNLKLAAADTATIIVRGNITVEPAVTRIDGIYVAGGIFNSSNVNGAQLVINGAVYAGTANLGRTLAASGCGVFLCDNAVHPAEIINFDLKYLVGLNTVLGSTAISWKEVAP